MEQQNLSQKQKEYEKLCKEPTIVDYHSVDHKEGMAPYFRIELKKEVQGLLKRKNSSGNYICSKKDGSPYDIYEDGLKIYTTINTSLQQKAEDALAQHLGGVDPSGENTKVKSSLDAPEQNGQNRCFGLRLPAFSHKHDQFRHSDQDIWPVFRLRRL